MSREASNRNLEERIARLEQKVSELEQALKSKGNDAREGKQRMPKVQRPEEQGQPAEPAIHFEETQSVDEAARWLPGDITISENWLNWLGIGLLLLGVIFLFKYSIDQGWLIPPVRSAFGVAVASGLLLSGFSLDRQKVLRQILLGGGIASFYITGFATFQLYDFVSYQLVWVFMVGVTIFSLLLSLRQDEAILSVVGTAGGLGTPFMLYTGDGSLPMLMLYAAVVLTGPVILYMIKGWKSLLWSMVAGGWLILLVGLYVNIIDVATPSTLDRWTLQLGVLFVGVVSWLVPVYREILTHRDPRQWPDPAQNHPQESVRPYVANASAQALSVLMPVLILFYSYGLWSISTKVWGGIALVASLLIGYSYLPLRSEGLKKLGMVHGFTALIMVTIAMALLLEGEILLIALTLEALGLRIIAHKTGDGKIALSSHILFGFIGLWMTDRLMMTSLADTPIFNLDAITELFIIAIAGVMVPTYFSERQKNSITIYRLAAHLALLGWFVKEFTVLQNGQAYVTVAWGIYALAILFVGFIQGKGSVRLLGMATIFLVVGKLFLVDLNQINTLLRILLFIGFGALFLLVSYLLHKKWGNGVALEEAGKK